MNKFGVQVPETINFNIGYFEGRQSKNDGFAAKKTLMLCISAIRRVGRFLCGAIPGSLVVNSQKLVYAKENKTILLQPRDRRRRNR